MENTNETKKTPRPAFWLRAIEHRKHRLTREYRATLGETAREGISDEDYATTMATLEKMARNLGWTEEDQFDRGPGRGFGPAFAPDFRPGGRHFGRGHGHGRPFPNPRPDVASDSTEA